MTDVSSPSPRHIDAMASVCEDAVAGWLWYCDDHDTHGNADHEAEVQLVAQAHVSFHSQREDCDIVIWSRTSHERVAGRG